MKVSLKPLPQEQYFAINSWRERHLQNIGDVIAYWLQWTTKDREVEALETTDDTHIILDGGNAPPHWPSVGQLTRWLQILRDSDGTATAAANGDLPVPQDCQARAESIVQQPTNTPSPTDEDRELIAHLRGWQGDMPEALVDDLRKAADRLESLLSDRAKLEEALKRARQYIESGGYNSSGAIAQIDAALSRSTDRAT